MVWLAEVLVLVVDVVVVSVVIGFTVIMSLDGQERKTESVEKQACRIPRSLVAK